MVLDEMISIISKIIKGNEGFVSHCYICPAGYETIGFGRNIDKRGGIGITEEEAEYLLKNDINRVFHELHDNIQGFNNLSDHRKMVLMDMCFNLGLTRFKKFKNMIKAIEFKLFSVAADEMINSRWYSQNTNRVEKLAKAMRYDTLIGD